jgi:predicted transcriptional regulator
VSEAGIRRLQQEPAPLPVRQSTGMTAQASVQKAEHFVRGDTGSVAEWITLPVTVARCLAAVRVGRGAKAQVAIDVGRDLLGAAEALRFLANTGLIERQPGCWDWQTTPRGKACMISIIPDKPRGRQGGRGILRPDTAAARLFEILDRPMRGRALAAALGVTRQRVHQLVVREVATGRLRCGDPLSPLLIVAQAVDRSLLLNSDEEHALSAVAEGEIATVRRMASRARMPQSRMQGVAEALRAKGLLEIDLDVRGQPAWRLTMAGATHIQRRTRRLVAPAPRSRVRSNRVWQVLGHLAEHGPLRTSDIAAAVGVPFQSMNALIQQLKRRGMVRKAGDGQRSGHTITEFGHSVLVDLRRSGATRPPRWVDQSPTHPTTNEALPETSPGFAATLTRRQDRPALSEAIIS